MESTFWNRATPNVVDRRASFDWGDPVENDETELVSAEDLARAIMRLRRVPSTRRPWRETVALADNEPTLDLPVVAGVAPPRPDMTTMIALFTLSGFAGGLSTLVLLVGMVLAAS